MSAKKWIQAYSGQEVDYAFDYEHPEAFDWNVTSVAHHLANINRYTGAARRTYTVAEHSWRVALYAADLVRKFEPDTALHPARTLAAGRKGIMHDATEMAVGDVNSPLKRMPFMAGFRDYEDRLHALVAERHKLENVYVKWDGRDFDVVRSADLAALEFERVQLLGKSPHEWGTLDMLPLIDSEAFKGDLGMDATEAEALFLRACTILGVK